MPDRFVKFITACMAIIISMIAVIFAYINAESNWHSMKLGLILIVMAQVISLIGHTYKLFDKRAAHQSTVKLLNFRTNLMRGNFREIAMNFQDKFSHLLQPNFYRYTQIIAFPSISVGFLIVLISIWLR